MKRIASLLRDTCAELEEAAFVYPRLVCPESLSRALAKGCRLLAGESPVAVELFRCTAI
jgi:hypothetical protein